MGSLLAAVGKAMFPRNAIWNYGGSLLCVSRNLARTRPLREKYGSQLLGTDHATNVVMDEKQRWRGTAGGTFDT